jgi:tetratricopeptide (TPR) repeat protein
LRPQLLNTIGVARCSRGDRGGLAEIERAIELGLATNDPDLPRAYNNLAAMLTWDGQLLRAREVWLEAKEVARRFGSLALDRWVTAQLVWVDYYRGRWADSLTGAEAFIAECEAGSPHYLEAQTHSVRAGILLARDDVGRALASSERGRELARQAGDPQALHSVLGAALRLELELDRVEEARALAEGLLASIEELGGDDGLMELAIVAERLGIAERVRALVARASSRPYVRAAALVAEGRYAEAAERLAATGDRITEAAVRRLAAAGLRAEGRHAEADEQLQQALAFYRSVGATRFIRASEALLAQTA